MCGIAGILGAGASDHVETVGKMVASMHHRGPDGQGMFVSPSGNCVLGHSRLAILDLSDSAAQPMVSPDNRWAFVYNGECYNYLEIREELSSHGEGFESTGDTEVVFRFLSAHGPSALTKLNAMFALALWDERERKLIIARDRYGQKPLYFAHVGRLFLFASEVRALLASGLVAREIDPSALLGYLAYGAVQEPSTIVAGVSLLRPAAWMAVEPQGETSTELYWQSPTEKRDTQPNELRESFSAAVKRHLVSDAPLGLFLSGGIDSSAITMAAARTAGARVRTLCVVFPEQADKSEAQYASIVAKRAGTEHTEVPVTGSQMLKILPDALDAMDQPTSDAINTYVVSHAARQAGMKVALSGLGGDELFGGYPSFRDVPRMLRLRRLLAPVRNSLAKGLADSARFSVRPAKLAELLNAPDNNLCAYLVRRRLFSTQQMREMAPELLCRGWYSGLDENLFRELRTMIDGLNVYDATGLLEMRLYMGQTLLRDSDVMGMNHGLEIRLPFLDAQFASCAIALNSRARAPGKRPKWPFVKAMERLIPSEIIDRPKRGFTLPFEKWMRYELREEVTDGIRTLVSIFEPLRKDVLLGLWDRFCTQPGKTGWIRPWSLYVLGRYLEKHELELPTET